MIEYFNTIIIGGGQAGLSVSYYLSQQNRNHIILEKTSHAAAVWQNRWDSFTLNTPNWMIQLPGAEYDGPYPDAFMARDDIVAYINDYVEKFNPPIRYDTEVLSAESNKHGYKIFSDKGIFEASNVVIAVGLYQHPNIPSFSHSLPSEIHQLHSSVYKNPDSLPAGAVLIVGSAQSGCQIAEELYQSGRKVYLSVSRSGRIPRRYRGRDVTYWMTEVGLFDRTAQELPSPKAKFAANPHTTGKAGGHTINLYQFARDGVVLLGRIQNIEDGSILLASDLKENLVKADQFEIEFVRAVDRHIDLMGLNVQEEVLPELAKGFAIDEFDSLNIKLSCITSVIWATGYRFDFSWVKFPIFDEDGYPIQQRGITEYPGLYFIGLPFLQTAKSGLLAGVGGDAAFLADYIASKDPLLERPWEIY